VCLAARVFQEAAPRQSLVEQGQGFVTARLCPGEQGQVAEHIRGGVIPVEPVEQEDRLLVERPQAAARALRENSEPEGEPLEERRRTVGRGLERLERSVEPCARLV
jgi:hypothetical protein